MSIKYLYDRKKIAITYGEQKYSYADVIKYVNYYSEFLDISKGDRVALMMENRPESIFSFFSIWAKKGIALSLDAGYTVEQLAYVLSDSTPKYIFISNKVKEVVEKANEKIGNIVKILVVDEISLPDNYIPKQEEYHNDSDEEVAIIVYTSGTTGNPKGVMITYENIRANMDGITAANLVNDTDSILAMLPYHHIMPLCFTLILPMYLGVPVILLTEISSASLLKTLQENVVTVILGVPRVWEMLDKAIMTKINESSLARFMFKMASKINSMSIRKMLFSKVHKQFGGHIRLMVSGGAKIDKNILEDFRTMGFRAIQGYGMTETAPIITFNVPGRERSDSAGEVIKDVEVKIADDGEILVKGKNVMKGYYNKPEKTAEVITEDGWFKTGDLASIDDEGYITIRGRRNSMIVLSNGKNIDPEKLENKVIEKSKKLIKELGVFGYNDKLVAIIVPDLLECRKQGITNIKAYIKNIVEDYNLTVHNYEKILDYKLYEEELPKTRVGKLRRFMLPELYLKTNIKKKKVEEPDNEVYRLLKDYIKKIKGIEAQPEENLELEIGMDSLDIVEFFAYVENSFGIQLDEEKFSEISNLKSLSEYINEKATKIESGEVDWKKIIEAAPPVEEKNRWATRVLRPLFDLTIKLYFRLKRVNRDKLSDKPQIFVSNHQSFIDSLVLGSLLPAGILYNTIFLAIDWYFKKGILKLLVSHGNVVLIDINKNIKKSVEEIAANVKAGKNVLIFPEGARTKDGKVAEFKKVFAIIAKELNVDVQCLGIKGAFEAYSRYMKFPKPKKIEVAVLEKFKPEGTYDEIVEKARNIIKNYVEGN